MATTRTQTDLTAEQRAALSAHATSVALSAGAGCGKTLVLTERFIAELDDLRAESAAESPPLSRIVAITFTERAAREMRDRVRNACHRRVQSASPAEREKWLRIWRQLETARISTIHSFCGSLLRRHAVEAGLDPRFSVLDETQTRLLLAETIEDELRRLLSLRDEAAMRLVSAYDLEGLRQRIAELSRQASPAELERWMNLAPAQVTARWQAFFENDLQSLLPDAVRRAPATRNFRRLLDGWTHSGEKLAAWRATLLDAFAVLDNGGCIAAQLAALREAAIFQPISNKKNWADLETRDALLNAAKKFREAIDEFAQWTTFEPSRAEPSAELGVALARVTSEVISAFTLRKERMFAVDFDELLVRARNLLCDEKNAPLAQRIAAGVDLVLVDEFQDTDPVQCDLVRALVGNDLSSGRLFFVGDSKQSIYRFRGADPAVFRRLRDDVPSAGRLPLTRNFRSQPAILTFVNHLFRDAMAPGYEALVANRPQVSPEPAVEFHWTVAPDRAVRSELREREADALAARLAHLLSSGEKLVGQGGSARAAQPGDIAILFRSRDSMRYYETALRQYELDYYLVGGHAFYSQQEIFDVLNLLRSIASINDLVALVGFLRSPFVGLSDAGLLTLSRADGGLADGLSSAAQLSELSPTDRAQAVRASETLAVLRANKDRLSVAVLLAEALRRTGFDAALVAEFLGARKLANLRKLLDQARAFDRQGGWTLADFIQQLTLFVAKQPDEALAATHAENTNVIRLMTIHQAKGLEFPIVVLPDLNRQSPGGRELAAFHPALGPLCSVPRAEEVAKADDGIDGFDLFRFVERLEDDEESLRLLYVATTRAADFLLLSAAFIGEPAPSSHPWLRLLTERYSLVSGQPLDGVSGAQPRVRVMRVDMAETPLIRHDRGADWESIAPAVRNAKRAAAPPPCARPIEVEHSARHRFSFSQLSGDLHLAPTPVDSETASLGSKRDVRGGTELGTLVHAALAAIDWGDSSPEALDALLGLAAARQTPSPSASTLDRAKRQIATFTRSARARELARAKALHREIDFLLRWPRQDRKDLRSNSDSTRHREVPDDVEAECFTGVIDCLYQGEDGIWRLLDFKTNAIRGGEATAAAQAYDLQLGLYALAAAEAGITPSVAVAHFLATGEEHVWPIDQVQLERWANAIGRRLTAWKAAAAVGVVK